MLYLYRCDLAQILPIRTTVDYRDLLYPPLILLIDNMETPTIRLYTQKMEPPSGSSAFCVYLRISRSLVPAPAAATAATAAVAGLSVLLFPPAAQHDNHNGGHDGHRNDRQGDYIYSIHIILL